MDLDNLDLLFLPINISMLCKNDGKLGIISGNKRNENVTRAILFDKQVELASNLIDPSPKWRLKIQISQDN